MHVITVSTNFTNFFLVSNSNFTQFFLDQIEDQENNAEQNNDSQIVDNEAKPNNEDLNEVLRTAKKIEKASVSGLGRQVSFPSLHCYLPSGWHCRKTSEDEG